MMFFVFSPHPNETRLNMLFIPTLPVKAELKAMLSKAKNTKQCRLSNADTVNVKPLPLKLNSALNSLAKQFSSTAWLNRLAIQLG